jgi:immune inhibitor A
MNAQLEDGETMRTLTALTLAVLIAATAFGTAPLGASSATPGAPLLRAASEAPDTAATTAQRPSKQPRGTPRPIYKPDGTIDIGPVVRAKELPLNRGTQPPRLVAPQQEGYGVGDTRVFIVLDDVFGQYFLEEYEVRLISDTVEIWVQTDLNYRTLDGTLNPVHPNARDPELVTDERIAALAASAELSIATDVEYFGDYAPRDGSDAVLPGLVGLPDDYYAGPPKRAIMLISNVRDDNFYDPVENPSYIAGFFSGQVNGFADRNIITIDSKAFDVNTGPPDYQNEATIAHEFQHLINADQDPDGESTWSNEGRSEFAEFINGYRTTPEGHRTQWSDYPENSLTSWGDQDADPDQSFEILADYQNAYWFMLYLAGRLYEAGINTEDNQFIKDVSLVTTDPDNGSVAIDNMLERVGAPFRFREVLDDFLVANLYGGTSDDTEWGSYISEWDAPNGIPVAPLDLGRLRRNLNFEGYDTPGAPPDGADYIEIGWSEALDESTELNFNGASNIPSNWQVIDSDDTGVPTGANASGNILYSGHADEIDNFLIFPVSVPASGDRTLSFDHMYNIETEWDFGFVQVTTDTEGATGWTSLALTGTITETEDEADPIIVDNVPGFTGVSGPSRANLWNTVTYDMSDYSGEDILLAFRYSADAAFGGAIPPPPNPGWYIDNISVGGTDLYVDQATLPANAQGIYEARGLEYSFGLRLVTFADDNGAEIDQVTEVPLDADGDATFDLQTLTSRPGFNEAGERVVTLVTTVSPPAQSDIIGAPGYGSYTLTGLPPTLYTSRARALGTSSNTSLINPRVYPGDTFTMTVTVDNLGRNDDLEAEASNAYVAVPIPEYSTFVPDTLQVDVDTENITYTTNLQDIDSSLPASPGVYWNGVVSDTADLSFELQATEPLTIGTIITPTAHIANGPFSTGPSQRFTDIQRGVTVVSPFALSRATTQQSVQLGSTATFSYTLVNTDDETRDGTLRFTLPDGTELESIGVGLEDPTDPGSNLVGDTFSLDVSVPSYTETGLVTVVTLVLRIDVATFKGNTVSPEAAFYQPDSDIPWVELPADVQIAQVTGRTYLPLVWK